MSFTVGNTVYPITDSIDNSLLQDLDPLIAFLCNYLATQMQLELGARWQTAAAKARLPLDQRPAIVQQALPFPPGDIVVDAETLFPMLAVFRASESTEKQTDLLRNLNNELTIMFILPPLDAAQKNQLYPFLKGASNVISRALASRANFMIPNKIVEVQTGNTLYDQWDLETNQTFLTATITCNVIERISRNVVLEPLEGIDTEILDESVEPNNPILINEVSVETSEEI